MKSKLNIKTILIIAIIGIISLIFFNKSFAANTAKVTVDTANIRKEANADSKIVEQAYKSEEVEILEKSGDWYKVKYNNVVGYLRKDLLDIEDETATENTATENTNETISTTAVVENTTTETTKTTGLYTCKENTKLKIIPLINGNNIKEINQGSKVNVLEINNKWALVESETIRGWVLVSKIEKQDESKLTEAAKQEETEEDKNESQEQEEQGTEEAEQTEENQAAEEVKEEPVYVEKTMYINSEVVNLREGESTSSEVLARLTIATQVTVVSENNGWSKVKVNGKEGYISSTLLSERKPEVTTSRSLEEQRQEQTTTKQVETKKETAKVTSSTGSATGSSIVEKAKSYIGCSYVYGGTSPSGFDCSGFVQYIYKQFGISLNRTAAAQYSNGVSVSKANLQLGDLVMFGSSASNINHVGIYMGNGKIVHAANPSRGVTTDTINSGYYYNNYVGARRIIN